MKYLINTFFLAFLICTTINSGYSSVKFTGNSLPVIEEKTSASTGLNNIYVLYSTNGTSIEYNSDSNIPVKWYKYNSLGGAHAEEIQDIIYSGQKSTLNSIIPNSGYIIEDNNRRYYFWVVDYSNYYFDISNISFDEEPSCDVMTINVNGNGKDISYYDINGRRMVLSREININYNTLEWDIENCIYNTIEINKQIDGFENSIALQVPLCNTTFIISGDKYLKTWNKHISFESDEYVTKAVEVKATAIQQNAENGENELGGSAPVEIEFSGYITDAVKFKEWQIAKDPEFEDILYRFNEENITQTFNEAGNFFARFWGSNEDGTCDSWSDTYQITIGESYLRCPNAFSPQASEGINDIWKVSYKSIINFECHIFNRWGIEIISFTNPAEGWDGKYKGKYVNAGVYFYVIKAKGADGKNYELKGDINIINLKESSNTHNNDIQ